MVSQRQIDETIGTCEEIRTLLMELLLESPDSKIIIKEAIKNKTILDVLAWINSGTDKNFLDWERKEK